ncbi:MAG TPA: MFS transporter [Eoetvoesiella sp.]|uniref:MFS transporter n=1 Tax=Eoetvoesiella sp. TaxID=1966355 RepID=UPI002C74ED40|nr:MFS transporter [Eoetvoesiella sp.]HWK62096.1 MFS transporter [Eoetvoesiella sp.]
MGTQKLWRYENGLLVMLFLANGLMFFDRLAINFLMPFLRGEFSLSMVQIGLLNAALGVAWAISGFAFSQLTDRRAVKRPVLVSAVVVFSLCSISSGMAATFAMLLLARVVMGLAEGPVLPVTQSLMMVESTPARRGFNMGFIQAVSTGVFGSMLAPVLLVFLAQEYGWRSTFYLAGIPGLVLAIVLWRWVREPSLERIARAMPEAKVAAVSAAEGGRPLFNRNVLLCVVIACLFITTFFSIMVFGPLFLVEQRKFTPGEMGMFMGVLGVSAVIGGALVPALSDRLGRRPVLVFALLLTALAPLVVAVFQASLPVLCAAIFISYLGIGAFPVFLATIPGESVAGPYASRAIALVVGAGEVVGGCVSPVLLGFSGDKLGAGTPFTIGCATALIAALVALFLRETAPSRVGAGRDSVVLLAERGPAAPLLDNERS